MELKDRIKAKRKEQRLSAEDLALKLKLKKENIYKWERGSKPSDPDDYKTLMDWLNENSENSIINVESQQKSLSEMDRLDILLSNNTKLAEAVLLLAKTINYGTAMKAAEELISSNTPKDGEHLENARLGTSLNEEQKDKKKGDS